MPGQLPSPHLLARRSEHLEAVPLGVEQVGQPRRQRPEHVLHGHHRDDLGVPRQAGAGHDQLVREPALTVVERPDRQAVAIPRGQERPLAPLLTEPEARPPALPLIERAHERGRRRGHPTRRLRYRQAIALTYRHKSFSTERAVVPAPRPCLAFATAKRWLLSRCCDGVFRSSWGT